MDGAVRLHNAAGATDVAVDVLGCFQMCRAHDVHGETPHKSGSDAFAAFTVGGGTFACGARSATNSLLAGRAASCDAAGGSGPNVSAAMDTAVSPAGAHPSV